MAKADPTPKTVNKAVKCMFDASISMFEMLIAEGSKKNIFH